MILLFVFVLNQSDGGPRSAGWRDHVGPGESRRRKFDFDFRDSDGHGDGGGVGRRRAGSEGLEDDRHGLPEWCTDDEEGEMGTFDSSGAFMSLKVRSSSSNGGGCGAEVRVFDDIIQTEKTPVSIPLICS